jgi:Tol biopolymer transport system component
VRKTCASTAKSRSRYRPATGSPTPHAEFLTSSAAGLVHLVSPLGGNERTLSQFPAEGQLSWSPDGRWLAASKARTGNDPPGGIHLISVATGEPHAVTFPKPPDFDVSPSFSPDGRELAFASCSGTEGWPVCDVFVLSLDAALRPQGAARPLTRQRLVNLGIAWTRDGRSVVYAGLSDLWRVSAHGAGSPEHVDLAAGGGSPAACGSRELGGSTHALVHSTFPEIHPRLSPDGRRIAYEAGQFHGDDIWLANADGSTPARLTRGPGRSQGSPSWSPDGSEIAFDSQAEDGHADVWTIGVDGSRLRQITHDPADDVVPSFSHDGRYIYFTSNRTGRNEIWRGPAVGGSDEQVTRAGGVFPLESADGTTLYYQRSLDGALLSRPGTGGEEQTIRPCVMSESWTTAPHGVFYESCRAAKAAASGRSLRYWDAATGEDRLVTVIDTDRLFGLSVAADGRNLVYGRWRATSDLLMIENFR